MKTLHIIAALAATLSAASISTSPAAAQAPASGERLVVAYSDLDLTSRSGVARLNRRILTAVQAACGTPSDSDAHGKIAINQCRHRTFDQASSQAQRAIALASQAAPTVLAGR